MRVLSPPRKDVFALLACVVVLAVAGTALAAELLSSTSGYTGCLSQNGDLLKFAAGDSPLKPCNGTQTQVHFSSGDMASLVAGTGLTSSTENGVVTLSVDPKYQLPQGCEIGDVPRWSGDRWTCIVEPGPLPQ